MPNLPKKARTPATMSAGFTEIKAADDQNVATIQGWDTFSPMDKLVLLNIPWYKTQTEACQVAGTTAASFGTRANANPLLRNAVNQRKGFISSFIRQASQDLLSKGVFFMHQLLDDPKADTKDKLAVIDRLMKLAEFGKAAPQAPQPVANTFISFQGSKSAPREEDEIRVEVG